MYENKYFPPVKKKRPVVDRWVVNNNVLSLQTTCKNWQHKSQLGQPFLLELIKEFR